MNKLTEEQIFKALEWHTNEEENDCIECPYKERKYFGNCVEFLLKDILNLLNRQKAEIERLKYNLKAVLDERADHSDAINEFIKRFEKKIKDVKFTIGQSWEIQSALKEVEKEMVGEG